LCYKDGEFLGKKQFRQILEKHGRKNPEQLVETVYTEAKALCDGNEIDDDISILVVEYNGGE
jgi:serine phosphatase RsbU (regulator of sigma subunit)